uniref:Septin-type G domain-containing protein n=1 Tax=Hucho hucho TaxID=62062 RepID=A0A4W5LX20_9TELE
MKRLHEKVNIIPLIAKADTMTPEECQQFKKQIMREITEHKIQIYEFPETNDEEENKMVKKIKVWIPPTHTQLLFSTPKMELNRKKLVKMNTTLSLSRSRNVVFTALLKA